MPEPFSTALVVGHAQPPITHMPSEPEAYLERLSQCITTARTAGVPVIYAKLSFRNEYVELPTPSASRRAIEPAGMFLKDVSDGLDPAVEPEPGDIVIDCTRISAFAYTPLEPILRALGIERIALAGISTGGVILGTLVDARCRDFEAVVLEDLCYQPGDAQASLLEAFKDPWSAEIVSSAEWLRGLGS
ncbi:cysteine hydrolase family protein [Rhodococcus sp. NPDC127530]|uniref:cysteine hydrolase family protein n=1 Tax=unclassified Rhodococcus (in: high G+C Gram-positive bacteria) TaxID=192944 RepID=UPI00363B86C6